MTKCYDIEPFCAWGCESHTAESVQHVLPLPWPELQQAVVDNTAEIARLEEAIKDIDAERLSAGMAKLLSGEDASPEDFDFLDRLDKERVYLEGKLAEREEAADELRDLIEDAEFALDRISEFLQRGD